MADDPLLLAEVEAEREFVGSYARGTIERSGFTWLALVTRVHGLVWDMQILMLRAGPAGNLLSDLDNRLWTLFNALRAAENAGKLKGPQHAADEDPFYVLLEDHSLVSQLAVTTARCWNWRQVYRKKKPRASSSA